VSAILETRGLGAAYGPTQVLQALDISVEQGGIVTLLGANGAGKTTTLRALCNMMVRITGEIRFNDRRIDGKATEDIVRLGIAHVPDGRGTFVSLSVEENLKLGAYTRRDGEVSQDFERIYGYFPRLKERRRQQAGTLSGGEQQMLAISRALMLRPKLLLLDWRRSSCRRSSAFCAPSTSRRASACCWWSRTPASPSNSPTTPIFSKPAASS
jgi:branched-chain amino acid transport system ATP-binding protein